VLSSEKPGTRSMDRRMPPRHGQGFNLDQNPL
jgi:hypothetical protein